MNTAITSYTGLYCAPYAPGPYPQNRPRKDSLSLNDNTLDVNSAIVTSTTPDETDPLADHSQES